MVHAEAVGSISYGKQPISRTKLEKKAYIFWYYRQINSTHASTRKTPQRRRYKQHSANLKNVRVRATDVVWR